MQTLKEIYQQKVLPEMKRKFGYQNDLAVPKIIKVSINLGLGEAQTNPKLLTMGEKTLKLITGQKPRYCLSRQAIAGFKLRKGSKIGLQVTLRGQRMRDFLERLIHLVLPRMRDFRGLNPRSFDGQGNYTLGIKEQVVFPEIKYDEIELTHGLEITINTSAKTDEEAKELLTLLGFPFSVPMLHRGSGHTNI